MAYIYMNVKLLLYIHSITIYVSTVYIFAVICDLLRKVNIGCASNSGHSIADKII